VRYSLRLSIGYRYGAPSDHARTIARLLPPTLPGLQTVHARQLTIDPAPDEWRDGLDFFGNTMSLLAFHDPIDQIAFTLEAEAERLSREDSLDLSPRLDALAADLAAYRSLAPTAPHHFLGPSPRIPVEPEIAAFARANCRPAETVRETVMRLASGIHTEMKFDPKATDVNTPPGEAFANRHGVCQDFSHVMISALRSLGIPAGYVSGFLRTLPPPGQERLAGADAMHAWVSAWCGPEAGWIEVDPTNNCLVGTDHVVVAYGRDYADVAPVRGSLRTSGGQTSHQNVDVEPLD